MKRKYKQPTIKSRDIETENDLARSIGVNDVRSYGPQLSKDSEFDSEEDNPTDTASGGLW